MIKQLLLVATTTCLFLASDACANSLQQSRQIKEEDIRSRSELKALQPEVIKVDTQEDLKKMFDLLDAARKGYVNDGKSYEQIVEEAVADRPTKKNDHGFIFGEDPNILNALQKRIDGAEITPPVKLDAYYNVSMSRGEIASKSFTGADSFAIFIPKDPGQYFIESVYEKNGVKVTENMEVPKAISYFRGLPSGYMLRIKITRVQKFNK